MSDNFEIPYLMNYDIDELKDLKNDFLINYKIAVDTKKAIQSLETLDRDTWLKRYWHNEKVTLYDDESVYEDAEEQYGALEVDVSGEAPPTKDCKTCDEADEYACFDCEKSYLQDKYKGVYYNDDCRFIVPIQDYEQTKKKGK